MKSRVTHILGIIFILVASFSIVVCAYTPATSMVGMDMSHGHSADATPGHIEHAVSLTLAVVPYIILLLLSFISIGLLVQFFLTVSPREGNEYVAIDFSPPSQRLLLYHFFSPRSPPVY